MPDTRRIITYPEVIRQNIFRKVEAALKSKFPIESNSLIADISNITISHKLLSHAKQTQIRMSKGNASTGVYGDISITDKATGKVVQTLPKHRIMNIPYFTNRYTFIVDGNEYNLVNQLRTKSGVYTRKRGNDELESSFNLSKGANFKLIMHPDTGVFKMSILHATLPLLAVLKVLGTPASEIEKCLGKTLYDINNSFSAGQYEKAIETLYDKLVKYKSNLGDTAGKGEKISAIRQYFSETELNPETTRLTLGEAHSKVNHQVFLQAMSKMLRVFNEADDVDDRDGLEFQQVYSPDDLIAEVLTKSTGEVNKIKAKLDTFTFNKEVPAGSIEATQKLKSIFSPAVFTRPVRSFLTTSSISRLPDQINPMEIIDGASIVTRLGEGAISSEQAVPDETRAVNYSYMGTIDPVMAPESSKVGIDNRFAIAALKGNTDNELYKEVRNISTGAIEQHRIIDLYEKYVGFPDDLDSESKKKQSANGLVPAVYKGKMVNVKRSALDFQIPSPHHLNAVATNNIPFLNANQANRILMGAKHQGQAMPLVHREARLVEPVVTSFSSSSMTDTMGRFLVPRAPVDGIVSKITDDFIYVKDGAGVQHEVDYATHMPLTSKTSLHNTLSVAVGDRVTKGQDLGDNNFSKNGKMAIGTNLNVAYMPYKGYNHEDGVVISESAAKKLTSMHSDLIQVTIDKTMVRGKQEFISAFPTEFSSEQLENIDSTGVVKKGSVLKTGDPAIVLLGDASENRVNIVLGNLHKSLVHPYTNCSEVYEGAYPATVVDVQSIGKHISVLLSILKPAGIGDKVGGTYGNKGVITRIEPDDKIFKDESGTPLDVVFTSAGVIGRINPSQILETALGKVAKKTGVPYKVENYSHADYNKFVQGELDKHGVKDKETLEDPETGKKIPGIFTGVQHVQKFHKTTDTNFSARGVLGAHDQDDAPVGSGDSGPKALGGMEVNALLAHNARSFLKESTMLRGAKNTEFWNNFQYGGIPHFPNEKKTFSKFMATLKQAGINVKKEGDSFIAGPLTDKDILSQSAGEIKNALRVDAKNATPEKGGLFDPLITGGLNGDRWGHVTLAEPVISPVFEDCVAALLGITKKELGTRFMNEGGEMLKKQLNALNIDYMLESEEKRLSDRKIKGVALDKLVRKIKYLKALKAKGLKAGDAYILSHVPVTPPQMRPISISKTGDLMPNDSNEFYKNLILNNEAFKEVKGQPGFLDVKKENRAALQQSVKELTGLVAPKEHQLRNRNAKGAIKFIAGDQPKYGFFQRKAIYNKMNLTGRATIAPDETLGLDEVGMPEQMAWDMYTPFILRHLTQQGASASEAKEEVENRTPKAKAVLEAEMDGRPVVINRAPSLWKHSLMAVKPKLRAGKTLQVNTLWEAMTNADHDGDSAINSIVFRVKKSDTNQSLNLTSAVDIPLFNRIQNTINNGEDDMPFSNTTLRYSEGLINLADFPRIESTRREEGNKIMFDVPDNIEILSVMDGVKTWLPVAEYSIHKNLHMLEVQTNSKRTIHCSSDDSLITVDADLMYTKAQPSVGMTVPRIVQASTHKEECYTVKELTFPEGNGHGPVTYTVNRDFGWLAGAFVGDGWLNKEGNDGSDSHHDAFSQKLTCCNGQLVNYFKAFHTHSAAKKTLPSFWMQTSEDYRWGLLAGLIDSDGSVSEVKAKSKNNSQMIISYTSISKALIFEIVALANSLGLTASAYFSKVTDAGNESWGVNFTTSSILSMQKNLQLHHSKKAERLSSWTVRPNTLSAIEEKVYTPRLSQARLVELKKALGNKRLYKSKTVDKKQVNTNELAVPENEFEYWRSRNSACATVHKLAKHEEVMTLCSAKKIIALDLPLFTTSDFWKKWKTMVEDETIVWEKITSLKPIPEITEAYDITAPPNFTMVTEAGFVIQDTMQVHLPITSEAVEEMKGMMPSQNVFSDKIRGSLLAAPSNEPITGLYTVTKNLAGAHFGVSKRFRTEDEAWKAYYKGDLKMTDNVEIG